MAIDTAPCIMLQHHAVKKQRNMAMEKVETSLELHELDALRSTARELGIPLAAVLRITIRRGAASFGASPSRTLTVGEVQAATQEPAAGSTVPQIRPGKPKSQTDMKKTGCVPNKCQQANMGGARCPVGWCDRG